MLSECIDGLRIKPGGVYVDGTLGRGGHALEIVKRIDGGRLIAIDRDMEAINEAGVFLSEHKHRITFIHSNFRHISRILHEHGVKTVDGILLDLGISSPQLDDGRRGFSYMHDAGLDMRMDVSEELTAYQAVNHWTMEELRRVFTQYGEERYAGRIARTIIDRRVSKPIETTFELNEIIISAMPAAARREPQHPSKRCYQALRIAVNDEIASAADALEQIPGILKTGGRACIISFHSIEDRLTKKSFAAGAAQCVCPKDFPVCVCKVKPTLKIITKKPIKPSDEEVGRNPRARSAKLRIAEKI